MESDPAALKADTAQAALAEVRSTRAAARLARLPPLWSWFGIYVVLGLQVVAGALPGAWGDRVPWVLIGVWLAIGYLYQWRTGRRLGLIADERPLLRWLLPGMAAAFVMVGAGYILGRQGSTSAPVLLGLLAIPVGCVTAWRGDVARRARLRAEQ